MPRDDEFERELDKIPDQIPDEDMPPAFALPDEPPEQQEEDDTEEFPSGVQEVEVAGKKMTVEEVGFGSDSGGGGESPTQQLDRVIQLLQRLPSEIADELKGG